MGSSWYSILDVCFRRLVILIRFDDLGTIPSIEYASLYLILITPIQCANPNPGAAQEPIRGVRDLRQ